jgi:hypothetical protein
MSDQSFELVHGFQVMLRHLYSLLNREALLDPYTGKHGIRFLDEKSFIAKINLHAQDFQAAYMITKHFFLPVAPYKTDDVHFWLMQVFRDCHK